MQKTKTRSMSVTLFNYQLKVSYLHYYINHNTRPETLKLVLEKVRNTLKLRGIGNDFLTRSQMAQLLRERTDKWYYMKLKSFFITKEMFSKLKRQPIECKKIFASYTSNEGLITRIHKELKKLNYHKINDPLKEMD
jgi:hypothetical protein